MKAFGKTVARMFKVNKARFALMVSIISVSLFLCAGLGVCPDAMTKSYRYNLEEHNVSDLIIKSQNNSGFTSDELNYFETNVDIIEYEKYFTVDNKQSNGNQIVRYYYLDVDNQNVNTIDLKAGRWPQSENECVIEMPDGFLTDYKVGDTITIENPILKTEQEITVVGKVFSPLYSANVGEPYLLDTDLYLDIIMYFDTGFSFMGVPATFIPNNEASIRLQRDTKLLENDYKKFVDETKLEYEKALGTENVAVLTLYENAGYASFDAAINKVGLIAIIFPIFFILVCALVASISTNRLIADDRSVIGCYYSLGIQRNKIIGKYFWFNALIVIIGAVVGIATGIFCLPAIIHPTFNISFHMGPLMFSGNIWIGLLFSAILLLTVLAICLSVIISNLNESPASLLTYKAPKPGKKILLERIPFIWKHLAFRFKSSARNIFRYKKNMILTILSVMGSTVLVFVGLGLLDNSFALVDDPLYGGISDPMKIISAAVTILACVLCALIIFNLVNMNVGERSRELATLKVLGYHDIECSFYTFRETFTLSIVGGLLGLPVGYVLMKYVLIWLDFGSVNNIQWYSYIGSFVLIVVLTLLVNFFLYPKVEKIDMSDSLKTID